MTTTHPIAARLAAVPSWYAPAALGLAAFCGLGVVERPAGLG